MKKRTIAIADIHGCSNTFLTLLSKFGLSRSDTVFLLGDFVDRGPDTKGVVEAILRFLEEGYDLRPLRGNHEQMMLDALGSGYHPLWLSNGGIETLMSYGGLQPLEIPAEHLRFLDALPFYRTTSSHIFVHAGLDLTLDDPFGEEGEEAMLWARETYGDFSKLGGKTLVTGHTPVDIDQIRESVGTTQIRLDNGCVFHDDDLRRGRLVAVVLETGQLFLQKYEG